MSEEKPKKIFETVIEVRMLSEGNPYDGDYDLEDVHQDMMTGPCSGVFEELYVQELTETQAVLAAREHQSDPGFLGLKDDPDSRLVVGADELRRLAKLSDVVHEKMITWFERYLKTTIENCQTQDDFENIVTRVVGVLDRVPDLVHHLMHAAYYNSPAYENAP